MKKKNPLKMSAKELQLESIKHSRSREIMPRPVIFKDKTKFDRNKSKSATRKMINEM